MNPLTRLRDSGRVRGTAQLLAVVTLVVVALAVGRLSDEYHRAESSVVVVGAMLANACSAASPAEIEREGLVEECRLAQSGDIEQAVPQENLPPPDADVEQVDTDTVPDEGTTVVQASDPQIAAQVDEWLRTHNLTVTPAYQSTLSRTVAKYLTENPPRRGRPPNDREISRAVTAALVTNPPAAGPTGPPGTEGAQGETGETGEAGRSIVSTSLDGCDVVFTYSDGEIDRIGPVCGADGQPATPEEIALQVRDYCAADATNCQGPAGYPESITLADGQTCTDPNGDHRYECAGGGLLSDP